jgi:O-antigen/teichoic acid export membrane protein
MTQLDMVLVNYYFPSEQAGLYAAASVLGKAVLYLPGGLVIALFPMVAENHTKGEASARLFIQVTVVTASLIGLAALVYWWLGPWLITLLYGQAYAGAGELLSWYGLAILPMALVMVAENFLIAKGRVLFAWLFLGIAPLQLLAIHLWHADLLNVIVILGTSGAVLMALGFGTLWREYLQGTR